LVPSGLEKNFLLKKGSAFYIGNTNSSPDAYLMFLDENGKKTAERVDIKNMQFSNDQVMALITLDDVIPESLIGSKNTKIMGLFIVSEAADIGSDTAVYSRGNSFGALVFDMLDQKGRSTNELLGVKMKLKSN